MTEQDFFKQIWRAYDKVTFDDNIKARVINVCFPTRSVKVSMQDGTQAWVRCERISSHKAQTGAAADEDSFVDNMFNDLKESDEKIERQSEEINRLRYIIKNLKDEVSSLQKSKENRIMDMLTELKKGIMMVNEGLTIKKSKLEHVEQGMQSVEEIIELLKGGAE